MTTRSKLIVGALALVVLAAPVDQALAGPIGDTGQFYQKQQAGYSVGSGGEFTVYNYTGLNNTGYASAASNIGNDDPSFQTFCIEVSEYTNNPLYFVVGTAAIKGGTGTSDPISMGTAWLYSQFAAGTLSGYNYATRAQVAKLQEAFWYLEGETVAPTPGVNAFYDLALANGGTADASAGYLNVYVLNNYKDAAHTQLGQDFLYTTTTTVPDGGTTLMLLGGALMGLGALRRKFNA